MTPKIRGVAPPNKRYRRPESTEKTPQKKIARGQKEPDLSAQALQKGDTVEVRLEEEGLHGSWHQAVICGIKPGLRQVEMKSLFASKGNPVKEWLQFGRAPPEPKSPLGTRKETDGKPVLRPAGPNLPPAEPSFRKTGGWPKDLWVEVFSEEAWWEGALVEGISASQMDEEDSVVNVIFPQLENLIEQVAVKNLRECKDWNEETGVWSIRGRLGKENDPVRALPSESPVCQEDVLVTGNGGGENGQKEDSSVLEIDYDGMEGPGKENLKSAGQDPLPLTAKATTTVKSKDGLKKYFGQLVEVVEKEWPYLVRVETLHYTLDEIQISVKDGFIALDVTTENIETEVGNFVSRVHNVGCAVLQLPTDRDIDYKKITWKLDNEVLTFTIPGAGGGEVVAASPVPK